MSRPIVFVDADEITDAVVAIAAQRLRDRQVEHRAAFGARLERPRACGCHQIRTAAQQADPGTCDAVFVQAGCAQIDTQPQAARLAQQRRPHPRAARVVQHDDGAPIMCEPHDLFQLARIQGLVGDGQPECTAWPWWFVTDLRGLHPRALVESPFERNGCSARLRTRWRAHREIASGIKRGQDRYPGVRSGLGQPVIIGKKGRKLRAEYPRCGQMDRVQGPQQPVGLDDGGGDNVLVDLDILEGVKQPLRIRD
jgi:hypothetical protein